MLRKGLGLWSGLVSVWKGHCRSEVRASPQQRSHSSLPYHGRYLPGPREGRIFELRSQGGVPG